jgi:hypothetical protein
LAAIENRARERRKGNEKVRESAKKREQGDEKTHQTRDGVGGVEVRK